MLDKNLMRWTLLTQNKFKLLLKHMRLPTNGIKDKYKRYNYTSKFISLLFMTPFMTGCSIDNLKREKFGGGPSMFSVGLEIIITFLFVMFFKKLEEVC